MQYRQKFKQAASVGQDTAGDVYSTGPPRTRYVKHARRPRACLPVAQSAVTTTDCPNTMPPGARSDAPKSSFNSILYRCEKISIPIRRCQLTIHRLGLRLTPMHSSAGVRGQTDCHTSLARPLSTVCTLATSQCTLIARLHCGGTGVRDSGRETCDKSGEATQRNTIHAKHATSS